MTNNIYSHLDPIFQVPNRSVRVVVPFRVIHVSSQIVTAEGEAIFENGKAIVLTPMTWQGVAGPIKSNGTLDHIMHWFTENSDYEFQWKSNDNIRIE